LALNRSTARTPVLASAGTKKFALGVRGVPRHRRSRWGNRAKLDLIYHRPDLSSAGHTKLADKIYHQPGEPSFTRAIVPRFRGRSQAQSQVRGPASLQIHAVRPLQAQFHGLIYGTTTDLAPRGGGFPSLCCRWPVGRPSETGWSAIGDLDRVPIGIGVREPREPVPGPNSDPTPPPCSPRPAPSRLQRQTGT